QQMLAIGRALLLNPKLLVMDEPTEGLAPVIVDQVAQALRDLAAEGRIAVLLIEQNLGVAISVADRIGLMVNGRIAREMPAAELAADRELQEKLLGVRSGGHGDEAEAEQPAPRMGEDDGRDNAPRVYT
ncbi:MAG: ABC transporter permease, partial [Ferrovibrionaceae bacterium]